MLHIFFQIKTLLKDNYLPAYGFAMGFSFQIISYCAIGTVVEITVRQTNSDYPNKTCVMRNKIYRFRMITFINASFAAIGFYCHALTNSNISFLCKMLNMPMQSLSVASHHSIWLLVSRYAVCDAFFILRCYFISFQFLKQIFKAIYSYLMVLYTFIA